jgi:hypothetical protein
MNSKAWRAAPLLLAAATFGYAAEGGSSPPSALFAELDADGDGRLTPRETAAVGFLAGHFPAVDADQDGQIDQTEFAAFEAFMEMLPEAADTRGDSI